MRRGGARRRRRRPRSGCACSWARRRWRPSSSRARVPGPRRRHRQGARARVPGVQVQGRADDDPLYPGDRRNLNHLPHISIHGEPWTRFRGSVQRSSGPIRSTQRIGRAPHRRCKLIGRRFFDSPSPQLRVSPPSLPRFT
ncbi:hypothetical protein PR202_gb21496 [Eleusine coracana subsp. coracana]|uniref:Uncharacterized protein n=1 Tax=Eleusine coracana subsp. coracana TaxID=191504 RepID=A0AAV5FB97_ELECO|nr:hypothetical protein PR202_gb21496 [Eleusine coracana subsp. coracana]